MTLPEFEDMDVDRAAVKIMKAGDGLSEALRIRPRAFHLGEEVFCALRGVVTSISHVEKGGEITRVHVVTTQQIELVDHADLDDMLAAAAERRERARASIVGQTVLGDDDQAEAF